MKKLIAVSIALFLPLFSWTVAAPSSARLLLAVPSARLTLYTGGGSFLSVKGRGATALLGYASAQIDRPFALRERGEEVRFSAEDYTPRQVLSLYGGKMIEKEEVEGVCVWYCTAQGLSCSKGLSFGRVNFQIAQANGQVVVGFPVIYGGF